MAAVTIHSIAQFFSDEPRLILRGENAVKSNHVVGISYDKECKRVGGKIQASMRDKTYNVEILLNDDGLVQTTKCSCPRGQLKCHHMAALMIHFNRNISSTDVSCQWSAPAKMAKQKQVTTVAEMYPAPKPFSALKVPVTEEDISVFHQQLCRNVGRHVGYSWLLSEEPNPSDNQVKTMEDILMSEEYLKSQHKSGFLLQQLELTQTDIKYVENVTKEQNDSALWYMYRKGRLTASNFGVVIRAVDLNRYPVSLFKRLFGEYDLNGMKTIQWGRDHEAVAVQAFMETTRLVTQKSGLWLHRTGVMGASPDRLVCDNALLEVKCPFTHRNETVEFSIENDKNFILKKDASGNLIINPKHDYYHQIQGQLYLAEKDMCFLCMWTLKNHLIVQVMKDPSWGQNIQKLVDFYVNKMLPKFVEGGC